MRFYISTWGNNNCWDNFWLFRRIKAPRSVRAVQLGNSRQFKKINGQKPNYGRPSAKAQNSFLTCLSFKFCVPEFRYTCSDFTHSTFVSTVSLMFICEMICQEFWHFDHQWSCYLLTARCRLTSSGWVTYLGLSTVTRLSSLTNGQTCSTLTAHTPTRRAPGMDS